jgi:hypothetical protein
MFASLVRETLARAQERPVVAASCVPPHTHTLAAPAMKRGRHQDQKQAGGASKKTALDVSSTASGKQPPPPPPPPLTVPTTAGTTTGRPAFSYSISSGFDHQPCELPRQAALAHGASSGDVLLDFNYWVARIAAAAGNANASSSSSSSSSSGVGNRVAACPVVYDKDITDMIIQILTGREHDVEVFKRVTNSEPDGTIPRPLLIIAALRGVAPPILAAGLQQFKFLRTCSSVPVRHMAGLTSSTGVSAAENSWRTSDVIEMNSAILWPSRPSIAPADLSAIPILSLFRDHTVILSARHSYWQDEVILNAAVSSDDFLGQYNLLLQQKRDLQQQNMASGQRYYKVPESATYQSSEDVLGVFKRASVADSGYFLLRVDPQTKETRLIMIWFKPTVSTDEFMLVTNVSECQESHRFEVTRTATNSRIEFSLCVSRAVKVPVKEPVPDIGVDNERDEAKASFFDDRSPSNGSVVEPFTEALIAGGDSKGSKTYLTADLLAQIKADYEANPSRLESLVATPLILTILGYPVEGAADTYGFLSTSLPPSSSTAGLVGGTGTRDQSGADQAEDPEDLEEGEEVDDRKEVPSVDLQTASEWLPVCAVDCEMCTTDAGLELCRVTIFSPLNGIVFDSLVRNAIESVSDGHDETSTATIFFQLTDCLVTCISKISMEPASLIAAD